MDSGNFDEPLFSATLTPYRSLGRIGFLTLMGVLGGFWFVTGVFFWSHGAWPVSGFFGLDFLGVWIAFRLNYRAARAYEVVEVSRTAVVIRKVAPSGQIREVRFNPSWVRVEIVRHEEHGVTEIKVRSRSDVVPVGTFLNPEDRTSFAGALTAALAEARR
jgi:uncharacterized membrane protein